jgi:transposase
MDHLSRLLIGSAPQPARADVRVADASQYQPLRDGFGYSVPRQTWWQGLFVADATLLLKSLVLVSRPPLIPAEKKFCIVVALLQGEVSVAEAARREKVSAQAIGNWKRQFLEAGRASLVAGSAGPPSPTSPSPTLNMKESCQLLDAGHDHQLHRLVPKLRREHPPRISHGRHPS